MQDKNTPKHKAWRTFRMFPLH